MCKCLQSIIGRTTGPLRLVPNGRARFRTSPKSTTRDDGRENIACDIHAYALSERKLYEHGYCESGLTTKKALASFSQRTVTRTSSFILVRSNAPVWARSTRAREYLSTSLQTAGPASLLPTICAPPNSARREKQVASTTDVLAEIMVWGPVADCRCAGLSFLWAPSYMRRIYQLENRMKNGIKETRLDIRTGP
jgi:hypothetical protein